MKKMIFTNMNDLKKMMELFEKHTIEYSWHFMNKRYELHLGNARVDAIKMILKDTGTTIPFKWGDYYW